MLVGRLSASRGGTSHLLDNVTFRRRNRLKKHFVITSNVLLFGYSHASDSAKGTYQLIDSFDWQDGQ